MNRGFSLLELMVVIAIMGVTMAVVAPQLANRIEGAPLNNVAAQLQSLAKAARGFAVLEGDTVHLALAPSGRELRVQRADQALMPSRRLPPGVVVRFEPESGSSQAETGRTLGFHPDGSSDAGILDLRDAGGGQLRLRSIGPLGQLRLTAGNGP